MQSYLASHHPEPGVSIVQADRQLSSAELDSFISIADCVVLAHSNESPSGILGKAAAAQRAILAAGASTLRRDVMQLGDGANWCPLDPVALADLMLGSLVNRPRPYPSVASAREFSEFLLGWDAR